MGSSGEWGLARVGFTKSILHFCYACSWTKNLHDSTGKPFWLNWLVHLAGISERACVIWKWFQWHIPYVPPNSSYFQIGIWSPKWHLFDRQFCVGLVQTLCKQWAKGFCKISKFWPLHSVRQNVAGFRRGLFTCFLGHTPLLQYYLLFGPHHWFFITVTRGCGPKSR